MVAAEMLPAELKVKCLSMIALISMRLEEKANTP
jgi:hypothetical protein